MRKAAVVPNHPQDPKKLLQIRSKVRTIFTLFLDVNKIHLVCTVVIPQSRIFLNTSHTPAPTSEFLELFTRALTLQLRNTKQQI
jgi:hypothetical protein